MKKATENQFIEAYDNYADPLFRHCYLRVYNKDLAQDLVQEAFIRVWNYISDGKEIRNFKSFLYQVTDNLIIDNSRKRKTVSLDVLKEKGVEPRLDVEDGKLEAVIDAKRAAEILHLLEDPYRQVILMRYLDDLSVKEIAKICGETENNVSVRIHRGLKKLNEILDHEKRA